MASNSAPPTPTASGSGPATSNASPAPAITTPQAFLRALVASHFDLPTTAAATPIDLLMPFVKDPMVLAELAKYAALSNLCLELRQAHFHSLEMAELAEVMHQAEDSSERRSAATALLRATKPAAAFTQPPAQSAESPDDPNKREEQARRTAPAPRPTCRPAPGLTVEHIVEKLLEAVENPDTPNANAGLATIAAFCDDDAPLNGAPLPTDDPAGCIEILAGTQIPSLHRCERRFTAEPLTISGGPASADSDIHDSNPQAATAACTIAWTSSPGAASTALTLCLKRAPISRCPDAWLIASLHVGPWIPKR